MAEYQKVTVKEIAEKFAKENAELTRKLELSIAYGALRDRVIETALDSTNTKQVLYALYEMLADGSLPDVCLLCSGIGQIRTGVDTETTCNACDGSGTSQETDLYTESFTVYQIMAHTVEKLNDGSATENEALTRRVRELETENVRLRDFVTEIANDRDDTVSPGKKAQAQALLAPASDKPEPVQPLGTGSEAP